MFQFQKYNVIVGTLNISARSILGIHLQRGSRVSGRVTTGHWVGGGYPYPFRRFAKRRKGYAIAGLITWGVNKIGPIVTETP